MDTIRTQGLTQKFGDNTAVNELTLAVGEGEVFGLVGPDGAGKTTVMRLLAGLMAPTLGDAWVYDCHTVNESEKLRQHISYMPQRFGLYLDLTVQENIDFYADLYNVPRQLRKEKIPELLAFSNMTPFRDRQARNLSGGMKQKLALACALVHTPKVVQAFTLIEHIDKRLKYNLIQVNTVTGTPISRLKALFELHVALLKEEAAIPRVLYYILSSNRTPDLKASMMSSVGFYVQQVQKLLSQGQEKGEVSPDIDVMAAAMMFLGMVQPLAIMSQVNKDVLDEYPQKLWQNYQRSIAM